eukprot:359032-Chlamydomonas_euryale.AAC.1
MGLRGGRVTLEHAPARHKDGESRAVGGASAPYTCITGGLAIARGEVTCGRGSHQAYTVNPAPCPRLACRLWRLTHTLAAAATAHCWCSPAALPPHSPG